MSIVAPVKIGILVDYLFDDGSSDSNVVPALQLVAEQFGLERPVEFVVREVQGLPNGSFRAVRDAFHELVDEGVVVIIGPQVSENGVALAPYVEAAAEVACITLCGTESMLGEWNFALPAGSMEEEPIIMAAVAVLDGCRSVAVAFEDSFIGNEYLRTARAAFREAGLKITGEVAIPQVQAEKKAAVEALAAGNPDAIMHVGFGLGIIGMNEALRGIGWLPPRYTTTAFEFAATSDWWRNELAGWIGLDQYDERNETAQRFLDQFEARYGHRPEYFYPLFCYDVGRMIMMAIASARPLTGAGVKSALEKIKMLPAASGAPGTRLRFGRFIRSGWVGSEFLVARRVLPDGSGTVLHGTIEGLTEPPALA
jgi:ABC-type branched-subunit amino acid transport system substrate-binding protein